MQSTRAATWRYAFEALRMPILATIIFTVYLNLPSNYTDQILTPVLDLCTNLIFIAFPLYLSITGVLYTARLKVSTKMVAAILVIACWLSVGLQTVYLWIELIQTAREGLSFMMLLVNLAWVIISTPCVLALFGIVWLINHLLTTKMTRVFY
jgi:hypothetical protein